MCNTSLLVNSCDTNECVSATYQSIHLTQLTWSTQHTTLNTHTVLYTATTELLTTRRERTGALEETI